MDLLKQAKRVIIAVIGTTVLLIGIAMIVLPGPALLVIPLAFVILATEFAWAKYWVDVIKGKRDRIFEKRRLKKEQKQSRARMKKVNNLKKSYTQKSESQLKYKESLEEEN